MSLCLKNPTHIQTAFFYFYIYTHTQRESVRQVAKSGPVYTHLVLAFCVEICGSRGLAMFLFFLFPCYQNVAVIQTKYACYCISNNDDIIVQLYPMGLGYTDVFNHVLIHDHFKGSKRLKILPHPTPHYSTSHLGDYHPQSWTRVTQCGSSQPYSIQPNYH